MKTGGLTAGLAFLPRWLDPDADTRSLEQVFAEWVAASGWEQAGWIWPARGTTVLRIAATAAGLVPQSGQTPQVPTPEAEAVVSQGNRLSALVHLPGADAGLVWVRIPETGDDSTHRAYLHLSAELMRRSPVVLRTVHGVDSTALWNRLNDAATVAGRTAHDFDNVLTGVIGFAELSLAQVEPGSPLGIYLAEIAKAGQRGQDFTRQLHQFNRVGQSRTRPGSLQPVLEQELQKCRQRCGDRIRMEQTIPAELPMITLGELASAIVVRNLLDNAVESMPNGGTVTVYVCRQTITPEDRDRYLGHLTAGPCLEVVIADTGSGIMPAFRDKVFTQPLATSKHRHRGLGLATVFRILYRHDAGIRIEPRSAPETGTIVRLLFPVAHRPGEASA